MRNLLILALVIIIATTAYAQESRDYLSKIAHSNQSKLNGKNGSLITLEAFDAVCLRNADNFSDIDNIMKVFKGEELNSNISSALLNNKPGKTYKFKFNNLDFLGGYIQDGGCSIVAMPFNPDELSRVILHEFHVSLKDKDETGMQITEYFEINNSSLYSGDIITLTYPKSHRSTGVIAYIPKTVMLSVRLKKIKSCSVDKITKDKLIKILCGQDEPDIKHRLYGAQCVNSSLKMRLENTVAQVYMHDKCGDKEFAKKLENVSLADARLMEALSLCVEQKFSLNEMYSSIKDRILTHLKRESCSTENMKLLAQSKKEKEAWVKARNLISNNDLFFVYGLKVTEDGIITQK